MKTMARPLLLLALLLSLILAAGCVNAAGHPGVSAGAAHELWRTGQAVIIDVRTPAEYRDGHIPGVANIPLDQLAGRAGEVPKDRKVLLICRSGSRSAQGAGILRAQGFAQVYSIDGGMNVWPGPVVPGR